MCGYIRRHIGAKDLQAFLKQLAVTGYSEEKTDVASGLFDEPTLKHFYPAFGGDTSRTIQGLIVRDDDELRWVDATWWYDCHEVDGKFTVGRRTTFNARNLESPYWKSAIRHRRGIVVCTGLGEGKTVEDKDHHYLVTCNKLLFLGAVYQVFPSGRYSCAVITRDEHLRFSPYHDKAFPLFLPNDLKFLKLWLSDTSQNHPQVAQLLETPRIFDELTVTEVKTFKGGKAIGQPMTIASD